MHTGADVGQGIDRRTDREREHAAVQAQSLPLAYGLIFGGAALAVAATAALYLL